MASAVGEFEEDLPVLTKDALAGKHGEYEIVLANPPFTNQSSVTSFSEAGESSKESRVINRDEFWASANKREPHWHRSSISSSTFCHPQAARWRGGNATAQPAV